MNLFDLKQDFINLRNKMEDFLFNKALPVIFKLLLLGMQFTLIWAFYQIIKQAIKGSL